MANFSKDHVNQEVRTELHDKLSLTGAEDSAIHFICIQVKEHSLECYTKDDAVV